MRHSSEGTFGCNLRVAASTCDHVHAIGWCLLVLLAWPGMPHSRSRRLTGASI